MSEMNRPDHAPDRGSYPSELPDYAEEVHPQVTESDGIHTQHTQRLSRWIGMGAVLLLLLVLTPSLYRMAKEWRSGELLRKSESAFAIGDSALALNLLKQSLALSPGSPRAQHAVELYNARSGDHPSLNKLLDRMRSGTSSPDELLGIVELEIASGHPDLVQEALGMLPPKLSDEQSLRRALALASLMAQSGDFAKAAESCLAKAPSFSPESASRLRVQAALYLLATKSPESAKNAVELLQNAVKGGSRISLSAWRFLAKIVLSRPHGYSEILTPVEITSLIKSLDSLPGHTVIDSLTAADLEILKDPKDSQRIVNHLKSSSHNTSRTESLEFARWLNARGFHEEVIEIAGSERPLRDTDWLLVTLDAETSLGNWKEVSRMLDSPAGAGIPDAVRHLFLARVALMNGNQSGAEEEWRNVGGALHLEKPATLAYIAGYEEQIGAVDRAARTYREMAQREGATRVLGLIGLIRCQPHNTPAVQLIPIYEELVSAAPAMTDARGDLCYLKLLIPDDVEESLKTSEKLLETQPNNLVRISAVALGKLRTGDSKGALDLYKGKLIDWSAAPEPWKGVRVAVLRANNDPDGAAKILAMIDRKNLRPEEVALIALPAQKKKLKP